MEWINVKDQTPKELKYVICYDDYYGDSFIGFLDKGKWYCSNSYKNRDLENQEECNVNCWMPLPPQPPQNK